MFALPDAKGVNIDLNVGIHDGHTGSIPVTHSLWAFNVLAQANGQAKQKLTDPQIEFMRKERKIPPTLAAEHEEDATRLRKVLFRRNAGPARLTIFEGTHESDNAAAIEWLGQQALP